MKVIGPGDAIAKIPFDVIGAHFIDYDIAIIGPALFEIDVEAALCVTPLVARFDRNHQFSTAAFDGDNFAFLFEIVFELLVECTLVYLDHRRTGVHIDEITPPNNDSAASFQS